MDLVTSCVTKEGSISNPPDKALTRLVILSNSTGTREPLRLITVRGLDDFFRGADDDDDDNVDMIFLITKINSRFSET
jgi:hypothetical protein